MRFADGMLRLSGSFLSPLALFLVSSSSASPLSLRPPWSQAASSEVSLMQPLATDSRSPCTASTMWWSQETPCFMGKIAILHARKKETAHRPKTATECSEKQSSVRPGGFNTIAFEVWGRCRCQNDRRPYEIGRAARRCQRVAPRGSETTGSNR